MDLSDDQLSAARSVELWLESGTQVLALGGYAGTGKTTLIKHLLSKCRNVLVCAFTGKAAHVLRTKGVEATTIHRLIYVPVVICQRTLTPVGDCKCHPRCRKTDVEFHLAEELGASLVIVDEASMVNASLYQDLLSFGVKILLVGDHGQLEPIGKNPRLMADPDIRLEKIHRQAAGSGVLQFAHHVRRGHFPQGFGDNAVVIETRKTPSELERFDVVLCGRNRTRNAINHRIRTKLGFEGALPSVGERVICLRNNDSRGVFNGMLATVTNLHRDGDGDGLLLSVEDDLGEPYRDLPIAPQQFGAEKTLDEAGRRKTLWDFGYCLTVHKSQGSEWDRVCVVEWIHPEWSPERWRYTAATRAAKELVYCIHPQRRP